MTVTFRFAAENVNGEELGQTMDPRDDLLTNVMIDDEENAILLRNQLEILFAIVSRLENFDVIDQGSKALLSLEIFFRFTGRRFEPEKRIRLQIGIVHRTGDAILNVQRGEFDDGNSNSKRNARRSVTKKEKRNTYG